MALDAAEGEPAWRALQTQRQHSALQPQRPHRHFSLKVTRGRTSTAGSVVLSLQVSQGLGVG